MNCKICNKEYGIHGLGNHLRCCYKNTKGTKEGFEEFYWSHFFSDKEIEDICKQYIEEEKCVWDIANFYNKDAHFIKRLLMFKKVSLRTESESKKTKVYKEKYTTTIRAKYGVDNISQADSIKKKKEETFFKNYGYKNNFCNESIRQKAHDNIDHQECYKSLQCTLREKYGVNHIIEIPHIYDNVDQEKRQEARRKTCLERYGVEYNSQNELIKNKIQETRNKTINSLDYFKNPVKYWKGKFFSSKLEVEVQEILNKKRVTYLNNIWISGVNVDLYIPSKNLIIEINGDYWHANPLKYKKEDIIYTTENKRNITAEEIWKKDKKQEEKLLKSGYNLLVVWEKDIKENKKDLEKYITNLITNYEDQNN